ncbi:MAG: hypothetical protein RMN51_06470 [Verrucomicrobiota bacterium]|nr:hypothetical protein [Limisphaera sp.]MDW8381735.1 hypothetical protein [Verrucomicrobiota bacterium]
MTEAGIEEALTHLNRNAPFFDPQTATNGLDANGWIRQGNVYRAPRRFLGTASYYDVAIVMNGLQPHILATGVVSRADLIPTQPMILGVIGAAASDPYAPIPRTVRVQTRIDPLFAVAMAAEGQIDLAGNNVTTDSFDSGDPNYSDNGMYPSNPQKRKRNGDVATNAGLVNFINVGNANINGRAMTGPNGTVRIGPRGYVSGGTNDDFNVVFPPVAVPLGNALPLLTVTTSILGTSYRHAIWTSGRYYHFRGLEGSLYVASNVNATLILQGDTKLTGNNDRIYLAPSARLILYADAPVFSIKGQGVVNASGRAENFLYFGTPRNTTLSFGGNASFTGAIYAPDADFTLGGGGNNTYDFVGASVTKTVKMNGHFNFHYDENLRRIGPSRGFIVTRWEEL